ncbi:response regulator [Desulfobacula toluolica]|uniref:histidine kinase n=1 Tax=Desulfobacula toluolica (strain DSM 7467 / Tol2) TaxID=651182 RepID=K0NJL8_DESTT|nr:response regulator [Desulfobacula toluolica]CCK80058.1 two component system sensor histidine kinase [Desulfobacula toluolica Tol2]
MKDDVHLLIVEDSPTQALKIQYFLEQNGYKVSMAKDGEQALVMLKDIIPTIIISDIVMPKMNGYELCDEIKKNDKLKDIPIILLTSLSEPENVINGLVCGATNFIVKPFDEQFLLSRIKYILINKEMRDSAFSQMGIEIFFRDKKYFISSERVQMIDLLLSTYEVAIQKSHDLKKANQELEQIKDELERRVLERTAELSKSNVQLQKEIEERKHVEEALRQSENKLAIKNQISQVFITASDDKLFENVLQVVLKALKSEYGIYGYTDESGSYTCSSVTSEVKKECEMSNKNIIWPHASWAGISGNAVSGKETLYSNEPFRVPEGHIQITRILNVPIIHRGNVIGNIMVGNKKTDYDNSDVQLMESIAGHLAPLLNAKLQKDKQTKERKMLEAQLQQAQRMESIGTLAGGIAHDFNNILFPIVGHTEMLLEDVPEGSLWRDDLNEIYIGALRARDLVKQILTFSRQESIELILTKTQPIIKEVLKLIRSTIPTTIEIKQNIETDCGLVKADPTQIHQIMMNLTTNAYHAMQDIGGELKVSLKEVKLSRNNAIIPDMLPGTYACLTVADTGIGMDKNITEKIFDPFFTTKEKGTGMGLSVVHGIVNRMGGTIRVHSEPGKGSEFNVYFPVARSSSEEQDSLTKKLIQGGTERLLLVDDENAIILMEKRMLERLGYQITSCTDSIEALEVFHTNPDKFDLVITDMAMPNMPGDKLSAEMARIRPDISILLCTGFSERISEEKAASLGIKGLLMKPIVMRDFAQKIRDVLDESVPAS